MKKGTKKTLLIGGGILGTLVILAAIYYFLVYKKKETQDDKKDKKEPLKGDKVYSLATKQLEAAVTNKANLARYSPQFMVQVAKNARASKLLDERMARDRKRKSERIAAQIAMIEKQLENNK